MKKIKKNYFCAMKYFRNSVANMFYPPVKNACHTDIKFLSLWLGASIIPRLKTRTLL